MPFDGTGFKFNETEESDIVLRETYFLLKKGWTAGREYTHGILGPKYCVLGALKKASGSSPEALWGSDHGWTPAGIEARKRVAAAAGIGVHRLWQWNDGGIWFLGKRRVLRAVSRALDPVKGS